MLLALLAGQLLLAGGCSSGHRRQLAATATMLRDLALKLGDYARADFKLDHRRVSSEEMGEFYYALDKARAFSSELKPDDPATRELTRLINDYAILLSEADRYRLAAEPDPQQLNAILNQERQVTNQAQTLLNALRD